MARGGYTFEDIQKMDAIKIQFLYHYQNLVQTEWMEFITNSLGLIWDRKTFTERIVDTSKKSIDKLFIPLSLAINPDLLDYVRDQFKVGKHHGHQNSVIGGGEYVPRPNEIVTPMSELSKEEFLALLGKKPL